MSAVCGPGYLWSAVASDNGTKEAKDLADMNRKRFDQLLGVTDTQVSHIDDATSSAPQDHGSFTQQGGSLLNLALFEFGIKPTE